MRIDKDLYDYLKNEAAHRWPERARRMRGYFERYSRAANRYIQIPTCLRDMDLHYEYHDGHVNLHIEGKFTEPVYREFLDHLRERCPDGDGRKWHKWHGMDRGRCVVEAEPQEWAEIIEHFQLLIDLFDPIIREYAEAHPDIFPLAAKKRASRMLAYKINESAANADPQPQVRAVGKIDFSRLSIPPYQRPYKWTPKNVNQLINDILAFKSRNSYRLGTLVLHRGEIVDGQQRIITLALLLKSMLSKLTDHKKREYYSNIAGSVHKFAANCRFDNIYSLHNIVENTRTIDSRETDLDEQVLAFILDKCEFVVIELSDISEAFQFFDSQNARGKDLEPHDLLKAYHLREIPVLTEKDSNNIDRWQRMPTHHLRDLFLRLFRAKLWSQGKSARYFTKDHTAVFKGVSLSGGKRYPFHQMEIIAHIFTEIYAADPVRMIDCKDLEYPYSLDGHIVNGSRFFDMVRHYIRLCDDIRSLRHCGLSGTAKDIMAAIVNYDGSWRTGDGYVRDMFETALLYYIDRFGHEELDKVIPKLFVWAYTLRLDNAAVQLASADNYARSHSSMLRRIHHADSPYDIINMNQDGIDEISCTRCGEIIDLFTKLKKYHGSR